MLTLTEKLAILADAAKYDASCASSGGVKRNSLGGKGRGKDEGKGVGSTTGAGICHAYAPDGRCISLLKILMTNFCVFDCAYCVNRASSNVKRARFSVEEVVSLTLDFYKRNYIEGLFLSSGIIRSPNETMEAMARIAKTLRVDRDFRGYIHLKTIPECDPHFVEEAGRYADRLSINVELPSAASLSRLAPQKRHDQIKKSMGRLRLAIDEYYEARRKSRKAPVFAPAGQSTQVIVGADSARDMDILSMSETLYASFGLRRVYYSAFSPIPDASGALPPVAPPLAREHRLYQADWLIRNYGFALDEIKTGVTDGMLDLKVDPKLAWALANRERFPVDVNIAPKETLLRVPGLGARVVERILRTRRHQTLRLVDLGRLVQSLDKVRPFVIAADWRPTTLTDSERLREKLIHGPGQLDLFAA